MKKILSFAFFLFVAGYVAGQTPYDTVNVYDPQNFFLWTTVDTANFQLIGRKNNQNGRMNPYTLKKYATPDVFATWVNTVFDSTGNSATYRDQFVTDSTGRTWYIDDISRGKLLNDIQQGRIDSISYYGDTLRIYENGSTTPFEVAISTADGNGLFSASNDNDTVRISTALLRAGLTFTQGSNAITFSGTGSNTMIASNSSGVSVNASGGTYGGLFSSGSASGVGLRASSAGISGVPLQAFNGYTGSVDAQVEGLRLSRSGIFTGAPGNGIYTSYYTRYGYTGILETARLSAISRDTSVTGAGDLIFYIRGSSGLAERARIAGADGQLTLPGYASTGLTSADSSLYVLTTDETGDVWKTSAAGLGGSGGTIDSVFVRNDSIYISESGTENFALVDPTGRNTSAPTSFGGDGTNIHFQPRVQLGLNSTWREEFPGIAYDPYAGRLVAVYRFADAHTYSASSRGLAQYSDDFGKTWSDTVDFVGTRVAGEDKTVDISISYDHTTRLFLAVASRREDTLLTDELVILHSSHDGVAWATYDTITKPAGTKAFRVPNALQRLQDNRLAGVGYTSDGAGADTIKLWFIYSSDNGKTWTSVQIDKGDNATDESPNEGQLIQKPDGTIYAYIRHDIDDKMYRYASTDSGATWGAAVDVTPNGWSTTSGSKPSLHVFGDSTLFAMFRTGAANYPAYSISTDWGATWTTVQDMPQVNTSHSWVYAAYAKIDKNSAFGIYSTGLFWPATGATSPKMYTFFFSSGASITGEQVQADVVQFREHTPGTLLEGATYYDGTSLRFQDASEAKTIVHSNYGSQTATASTSVSIGSNAYWYEKIDCNSLASFSFSPSGGIAGGQYKFHFQNASSTVISVPTTIRNLAGTPIASATIDSAGLFDCIHDGTNFHCTFSQATPGYGTPSFSTIAAAVDYIGTPYLEVNAALETEYSDEAAVDTLHDFSGNGRHFAASGTARPTYDATSATSGLPAFKFDGGDYATNTTSANWVFLHSDSSTIFVVAKPGNTSNPDAAYGLMGNNGSSSTTIGVGLFWDDRSSISRNDGIVHSIGKGDAVPPFDIIVNSYNGDTINFGQYNSHVILSDAELAVADSLDRSKISINGGGYLQNNASAVLQQMGSTPSTSNSTYSLQIGAVGNNTAPMVGEISVIVVWDRILTPAEIAILQTAYENEYGP